MRIGVLYFVTLLFICCSCQRFEEDHLIKDLVRNHLERTLYNPESFDEVEWSIMRNYQFGYKDTLNEGTPLFVDFKATEGAEKENGVVKLIELTYRAKNDFGLLIYGKLYAIYYDQIQVINFEDASYSVELQDYLPQKKITSKANPKKQFLSNEYYMLNNGKGTYKGFLKVYPEFALD
ncbi:hypothetical protein [Pseudotamlana agarivorans]|uniref:hypothetical protein n=1 Tax=Pseudotamlana agarivorans TaxID=481183 RepID=UPI00082FC9AB|nr:hypothetical protein [Tamlana agarivorans]